jgi:D-3-phosphoglycerate dehydrogenase
VRVINCARGGIVDEKALIESIEKGHVKGAALDVFEKEPLDSASPLLKHPEIILTPHLGASTEEAQVKGGDRTVSSDCGLFSKRICASSGEPAAVGCGGPKSALGVCGTGV